METRLPPQSLEMEQAVLGAMLIDDNAVSKAAELLTVDSFYRELHKKIFAAIMAASASKGKIDYFVVAEYLRSKNQLEAIGGASYLSDLIESCASSAAVERYAEIVAEKASRRAAIESAHQLIALAHDPEKTTADIKEHAEKLALETSWEKQSGGLVSASKVAVSVVTMMETQARNRGKILGLQTGIPDLDLKAGGLRKKHLVIVGARPSMGKSAMGLQIAGYVASCDYPSIVFGHEMANEETLQRYIANRALINSTKLERGQMSDGETNRFMDAVERIERLPLFLEDTADMTTSDMRSHSRKLLAEHGQIGCIVVDYLQIVALSRHQRSGNRAEEIGAICRDLKAMAVELDTTVIAMAQLNREVEKRENKRPQLSDLKESGDIEAAANRVLFLYREEYYRAREQGRDEAEQSPTDIIVAKNRGGRIGTVQLMWTGASTRFDCIAPPHQEHQALEHNPNSNRALVFNGREWI